MPAYKDGPEQKTGVWLISGTIILITLDKFCHVFIIRHSIIWFLFSIPDKSLWARQHARNGLRGCCEPFFAGAGAPVESPSLPAGLCVGSAGGSAPGPRPAWGSSAPWCPAGQALAGAATRSSEAQQKSCAPQAALGEPLAVKIRNARYEDRPEREPLRCAKRS